MWWNKKTKKDKSDNHSNEFVAVEVHESDYYADTDSALDAVLQASADLEVSPVEYVVEDAFAVYERQRAVQTVTDAASFEQQTAQQAEQQETPQGAEETFMASAQQPVQQTEPEQQAAPQTSAETFTAPAEPQTTPADTFVPAQQQPQQAAQQAAQQTNPQTATDTFVSAQPTAQQTATIMFAQQLVRKEQVSDPLNLIRIKAGTGCSGDNSFVYGTGQNYTPIYYCVETKRAYNPGWAIIINIILDTNMFDTDGYDSDGVPLVMATQAGVARVTGYTMVYGVADDYSPVVYCNELSKFVQLSWHDISHYALTEGIDS